VRHDVRLMALGSVWGTGMKLMTPGLVGQGYGTGDGVAKVTGLPKIAKGAAGSKGCWGLGRVILWAWFVDVQGFTQLRF
jgi:hypothetical protein